MIDIAALKCNSCKHYSKETGCEIEHQSYGLYRSCILDKHDLHEPASESACGEEIELHLPTLAEIMERNRRKASK